MHGYVEVGELELWAPLTPILRDRLSGRLGYSIQFAI